MPFSNSRVMLMGVLASGKRFQSTATSAPPTASPAGSSGTKPQKSKKGGQPQPQQASASGPSKRVIPTRNIDLSAKERKALESRPFGDRYRDSIEQYFATRILMTRLDKTPEQLTKEWKIAKAFDQLKQREWELEQRKAKARQDATDAALQELRKIDPALYAAALTTPPPPPAWLRAPTLTPPVAGYTPAFGFPIHSEEENEQTLIKELGLLDEAAEEAKAEKRRREEEAEEAASRMESSEEARQRKKREKQLRNIELAKEKAKTK